MWLAAVMWPAAALAADPPLWTLESALDRAVRVAPEISGAESLVRERRGALEQAGRWPNPELDLRADDRIGKNTGSGDTGLTQIALRQPVPLGGRLARQREMTQAELEAAQSQVQYQRLRVEAAAARSFHTLQLTAAQLRIAEERVRAAEDLRQTARRREQAGDISRLERLRLDIVHEQARQALAFAEGTYSEALADFQVMLALGHEARPETAALQSHGAVPPLEQLEAQLDAHPALRAAALNIDAARAGVGLARARRWEDPAVTVYRERDYINGRREDITGIGLAIPLPLWNQGGGRVTEALAAADQSRSTHEAARRELEGRLHLNHLHLGHLVEQAEHFREHVFAPAQQVYTLTRTAYAAGEADMLAMIDANDTWFEAQSRYLELLHEAWTEAAELRLSAGIALVPVPAEGTQP